MTSNRTIPEHHVVSDWADLSRVVGADAGFAHHGLAVTAADELIAFHAGQLTIIAPDGSVRSTSRPGFTDGHGLTLVEEAGNELLWIADPGFAVACGVGTGDGKLPPDFGTGLDLTLGRGRVAKMTLDGTVQLELDAPPTIADAPGPFAPYAPTSVAVDLEQRGGHGDVWVADGYGSQVVHRFDSSGGHIATLTGAEGAGRFDCPHAIHIRYRDGAPAELYVADRGNARIAVYGLDGAFKRVVGAEYLSSPSGFTEWHGFLVVVELFSRLAVLDDDELIGYLGADPDAMTRSGWPNALNEDGSAREPVEVRPGLLNSPHAAVVNSAGDLIVAEWLIGGRYTKFAPAPADLFEQQSRA